MSALAGFGSMANGKFGGADGLRSVPDESNRTMVGAVFFNQQVKAQRIAYVLDFSVTMKGERDELMRRELTKSLKALPVSTQYSVICFSGPVWLPGDEVAGGTVKSRGKTYEWTSVSPWEWKTNSPLMKAPWLPATPKETQRTISLIGETKAIGGTDWEAPLEIAIAMQPPPEIIFFMTDGIMEQRDMLRLTRGIAAKAKAKGVVINTVAMMEPGAEEPLADLAKRTGGQFTIVEKGGITHKGGSH